MRKSVRTQIQYLGLEASIADIFQRLILKNIQKQFIGYFVLSHQNQLLTNTCNSYDLEIYWLNNIAHVGINKLLCSVIEMVKKP